MLSVSGSIVTRLDGTASSSTHCGGRCLVTSLKTPATAALPRTVARGAVAPSRSGLATPKRGSPRSRGGLARPGLAEKPKRGRQYCDPLRRPTGRERADFRACPGRITLHSMPVLEHGSLSERNRPPRASRPVATSSCGVRSGDPGVESALMASSRRYNRSSITMAGLPHELLSRGVSRGSATRRPRGASRAR